MTQELLKITETEGGKSVASARELHEFLEVKTDFTNWCKRMFKYGFKEGTDYALAKIGELDNQVIAHPNPRKDYALTLDTAKEISMIQRSDKGRQARQYFIECEKKANALMKAMSPAEMLLFQAQRLVNMEKEQEEMKKDIALLNARTTTRPDYFTVMGYSVFNKKSVGRDIAAVIGRNASSICKQRGLAVDKVSDPRFGLVGSYPTPILDEVFELMEIN